MESVFTRTIPRLELIAQSHSEYWIHVNRQTFGLFSNEKSTALKKKNPFPASFRSAAQAPPDREKSSHSCKQEEGLQSWRVARVRWPLRSWDSELDFSQVMAKKKIRHL